MKRFVFISAICLSFLLSCKGELDPLPDVTQDGVTLITADLESIFNADLRWQKGSYIGIYGSLTGQNEKYYLKDAGVDKSSAEFYGPKVQGLMAAYFPYDPSYSGSVAAMPVNLEPEQEYSQERDSLSQFLYYTPKAFGHLDNAKLKFEYPFGMLRVKVGIDGIEKISQINLSTGSQIVTGLGIVYPDGSLVMDSSSQTAVLDCGGGVSARREDGTLTDFYLVLSPATYTKMQVDIVDVEGNSIVCELNNVVIPRVSASNFTVVPVTVTGDLSGMKQTEVSFD